MNERQRDESRWFSHQMLLATVMSDRIRFVNMPTVKLLVGTMKDEIVVHRDILCGVSSFFEAAFASHFKESSEKTMTLPTECSETVEDFIRWLYAEKYEPLPDEKKAKGEQVPLRRTIELSVFADKYDIPDLQRCIIRFLLGCVDDGTPAPLMVDAEWAYQNTCRGSGIRRLLADWYALFNIGRAISSEPEKRAFLVRVPELAVDLVITMSSQNKIKTCSADYSTSQSEGL